MMMPSPRPSSLTWARLLDASSLIISLGKGGIAPIEIWGWGGGMRHSISRWVRQNIGTGLFVAAIVLSVLSCAAFLASYLRYTKKEVTVDGIVLILLFGGIGILLLPWISRLKIGVVELERLGKEISGVKEALFLHGGVVRDEHGIRYYIDNMGSRHQIPDDATERFLRGPKAEIPVSAKDLDDYPLAEPMDSVLTCTPRNLEPGPHIFVVLNGMWYHVGIGDLFEWGKHKGEFWDPITETQLRRYRRGR